VLSVADVPGLLFVVIGVLLWHRFAHHDRGRHAPSDLTR
jgi:hypothetical protein